MFLGNRRRNKLTDKNSRIQLNIQFSNNLHCTKLKITATVCYEAHIYLVRNYCSILNFKKSELPEMFHQSLFTELSFRRKQL